MVGELGDVAVAGVVAGGAGLVGDDLLEHVRLAVGAGQRAHRAGDRADVLGGHVLGAVDAEAGDAEADEVVEVADLGGADLLRLGLEVGQADQLAGADLLGVVVVGDVPAAAVEVAVLVQPRVVVLRVLRTAAARPAVLRAARGHVVEHRVGVDLHPGVVAGADHVRELLAVAAAAVQLVAHRLVVLVPGVPLVGELHVLLRRRDLHRADALRAQGAAAFRGDRVPRPLE